MELAAGLEAAVPGCGATQYDCVSGPVVVVRPESIIDVLTFLKEDPDHACDMLVDLTGVDRIATEGVIDVIYLLRSVRHRRRYTLKARVPADDPVVATATGLWKSANWAEREVWDMFGVRFEGHPDLRRIMMYPEFEGHPLRKAYPFQKRQPLVEERDPISDPWPSRDGL